jgi:hypothetical protein
MFSVNKPPKFKPARDLRDACDIITYIYLIVLPCIQISLWY